MSWSPEARAWFTQIADEIGENPEVKVGLQRTGRLTFRPTIMANRKIAVAGFDDGIAVRANDEDKARVLRIFATRELGRRDHIGLRGMIFMPWSTHEHWREFMQAAVNGVLSE